MLRTVAAKVMWLGRATVFMVGLAVIVALVFGVASMALGANGQPWILGEGNAATAITSLGGAQGVDGPMVRLTNNNAGSDDTALSLNVQSGEAPMTVDSSAKVTNLNADKLDGRDASAIGVNGLQLITSESAYNSNSGKTATATCPVGKVVVGTGAQIHGGKSGVSPSQETDVVIDQITPFSSTGVFVVAYEEEPTNAFWSVEATAVCATAP